MSSPPDPRRCIGAHVHAKAIHVTSFKECSRLFGSLASKKLVSGVVKEVLTTKQNGRSSTSLRVQWLLAEKQVEKTLHVRNVRVGSLPQQLPPTPNPSEQQQETSEFHTVVNRQIHTDPNSTTDIGISSLPSPSGVTSNTVICHGRKWLAEDVKAPIGGFISTRMWSVTTPAGEIIREGGDLIGRGACRTPYDYFLCMFPLEQLTRMTRLTTLCLKQNQKAGTTVGELLRFFGVLILATRFEFGSRADLWATTSPCKHIDAPGFGKRTGMPRSRFDMLWQCLRFSEQRTEENSSSVSSRWSLVDDFVESINKHRAANVTPSELLCVDESISRWYGLGGAWINYGLSMYVAIDRKPENGCEIQNSACGRSGILLQLQLVTTVEDEENSTTSDERDFLHGTTVLRRLIAPWGYTERIVCADSYFASVEAADVLRNMGLRFIGIVKTATKQYPMAELSSRSVKERGDRICMVHKNADGENDMMALMWVDRERRYFISTTSTCKDGKPYERIRWRQENGSAKRVCLTVRQPEVAEVYYDCCADIDRHNRCRQDDLRLEHKLVTFDWSRRVGLSLLGMVTVDSWLLYTGAKGGMGLKQRQFYEELASQLLDNCFDYVGLRPRGELLKEEERNCTPISALGSHLTPTKKRKKSGFSAQRDCRVCHKRSTFVCSTCKETLKTEVFVCSSKTGRPCFIQHQKHEHGMSI